MKRLTSFVAALAVIAAMQTPAAAAGDAYLSKQWALTRIQAPQAWSSSRGAGVTIAVVDTGIDLTHPDLRANLVPGTTIVKCKGQPCSSGGQDDQGHGTHVAGIAAAVADNGIGVAGVAPSAKLMPVKVLGPDGSGSLDDIATGIRWAADHGARVINLSLGAMSGVSQVGTIAGWFKPIHASMDYAWSKGAVIVVAAGNDTFPLCAEPATYPKALCVGATNNVDTVSYYSNSGDVDVVAPGGFGSVFCEDYSRDILSTIWAGSSMDCQGPNALTGYETLAGTSMAAPHVAGLAALLLAQGLTNQQTVDRIQQSADDLGAPGKDPVYGYGRINAAKAVQPIAVSARKVKMTRR